MTWWRSSTTTRPSGSRAVAVPVSPTSMATPISTSSSPTTARSAATLRSASSARSPSRSGRGASSSCPRGCGRRRGAARSRYGMPKWQFTLSATAANVEVVRLARQFSGREVLVMFDGKYHGHLDPALVVQEDGRVRPGVSRPDRRCRRPRPHRPVQRRRRARASARPGRCRPGPGRTRDDERRLPPPRTRLPRRAARADTGSRDSVVPRRDPHPGLRLRRPDRALGPRPRPVHGGQVHRGWRAAGCVRHDRADRCPAPATRRARGGRHRPRRGCHRRHAVRERAVDGGGTSHAHRGAHRRGVRPHRHTRRPARRRAASAVRGAALEREPARRPRRILLHARAADRGRRLGRRTTPTSLAHPLYLANRGVWGVGLVAGPPRSRSSTQRPTSTRTGCLRRAASALR